MCVGGGEAMKKVLVSSNKSMAQTPPAFELIATLGPRVHFSYVASRILEASEEQGPVWLK